MQVPRNHPEIERLEGRYKNLGGLKEGLVVELANGNMALVAATTPEVSHCTQRLFEGMPHEVNPFRTKNSVFCRVSCRCPHLGNLRRSNSIRYIQHAP